jgi:hypothetical protein
MKKNNFLVCPKCGVRRFILKNKNDKSVVVNVTRNHEIIPINENDSIDNFNTEDLYCIGCSWVGSKLKLLKYMLIN